MHCLYSTYAEKMPEYLTIDDLKKVYSATFGARAKWRNILLMLEVPPGTIDGIGMKWQDNPDDCYREGLNEWLRREKRSWEDMVVALSSRTVGYNDIARTIERDYVQSTGGSNPTDVKTDGKCFFF